ncbi:MAG: cobalamin-binding protein [Candidatus Omnitrophota bacterium]
MKKSILMIGFLLAGITCASGASVERYVSLSPATTEILFALGLKDKIVAVTSFCNFPEETKKIAKIGTFSEPNIEIIISLKPTIVFATGLEQTLVVSKLKKSGLRVVVSDPKNIAELFESLTQIGKETGKEEAAEELKENMLRRLEAVKAKAAVIPAEKRVSVFIEIWHDPIMTAGPGSFVDELINLAGARNIANDAPRAYSRFSNEVIIERNPDVIILGYMDKANESTQLIKNRMGWQNIAAVKNDRIVKDIDPDLILRPGPRLVDGLERIYQSLYDEK